jgi:hypothetical protein
VILPCGAATSQTAPSSVDNTQVQSGGIFSDQTLNVEFVTDSTTGVSTGTGNAYDAGAERNDLDMHSNQLANGDVSATLQVNVETNAGATTTTNTTASGNVADANVFAGTLTGVHTQQTGPASISAYSNIDAINASAGDVNASTQALGNSQGIGVSYGVAGNRVYQTNDASVRAEGVAAHSYVSGTGVYAAGASGDNVTLSGVGGSGERLVSTQQNNGGVQAVQNTTFGSVQSATTSATAAGNNLNAVNEGFLLDAAVSQQNNQFVSASAGSIANLFGSGSVIANGVGNSVVTGDAGAELTLDNSQENNAGIEASAAFEGRDGYDGSASATATGNAVTGYACADCGGRVGVTNSQTNNTDVVAQASTTINGGRSAFGMSTAIGNTATYYVSRPSGQ